APSRSFRRRINKRLKASSKPVLDQPKFEKAVSQLLPRFTAEELCNVITLEEDPLVCWELFNWAVQQPRFRHDVSTYHITIKKLGVAKMYEEMDVVVNQMGVVYKCLPNSYSYDFLIYGLCAQGRTNNARELCNEMKKNGFVPSSKSYNSLVNALALSGEVEEALHYLREMIEKRKSADFITYRTILDEICRRGRAEEATGLLKELQDKDLVDGHTYRKLLYAMEDDFGN
ncbi:Pentatricopeptide repeat - like 10, partial [Theobroma cacao]